MKRHTVEYPKARNTLNQNVKLQETDQISNFSKLEPGRGEADDSESEDEDDE